MRYRAIDVDVSDPLLNIDKPQVVKEKNRYAYGDNWCRRFCAVQPEIEKNGRKHRRNYKGYYKPNLIYQIRYYAMGFQLFKHKAGNRA